MHERVLNFLLRWLLVPSQRNLQRLPHAQTQVTSGGAPPHQRRSSHNHDNHNKRLFAPSFLLFFFLFRPSPFPSTHTHTDTLDAAHTRAPRKPPPHSPLLRCSVRFQAESTSQCHLLAVIAVCLMFLRRCGTHSKTSHIYIIIYKECIAWNLLQQTWHTLQDCLKSKLCKSASKFLEA